MSLPAIIETDKIHREHPAFGGRARLRAIQQLFSYRSLRIRLVFIVLGIDCLAVLLTGPIIILKARTATKLEIASAMQLAGVLVTDTIRLLQDTPAPVLLQSIDLHFQSVRHVRISVVDDAGHPIEAPASPDRQPPQTEFDAPDWFSRLIAPTIESKNFPIVVRSKLVGIVTVRSAPNDEIDESWNYAYALAVTALCMNVAVIAALFLLFGRVLAPLTSLAAGLKNVESKNYAVRLPQPSLPELSAITEHFNRAASALSIAQSANHDLTRKLLTAQDDERRRTALELHDEAGPCLFALEANASSIAGMIERLPDNARLLERACDIVALVERIQAINRRVLDSLRPMALGRIPLRDCLINLLVDFDNGEDRPIIDHTIGSLCESYGLLFDLTIYRCVQEGLFNAVRHARAERITLTLDERHEGDASFVDVRVFDNGIGLNHPLQAGVGISGMRERVEALSGTFDLRTSPEGTVLAIMLPLGEGAMFDLVADQNLSR